ncbi:MAG: hypothetical protein ABIF77_08100, partial [bacterium]
MAPTPIRYFSVGVPVVALVLLFSITWLTGCGNDHDGGLSPLIDLGEIPLSDQLRQAVQAGRRSLADPVVDNETTNELNRFNHLVARVFRPAERQEVGDELYTLWGRQPEHCLWIDMALDFDFLLHRGQTIDSLFQLPILTDTTSTRASFAQGLREKDRGRRTRLLQRAEQLREELNPLEQVWLTHWIALDLSNTGQHLDAVDRLVSWLPRARVNGGMVLEMFLWNDIARYLTRAERLDDALHAATLAEAMATNCGADHRALQYRWRIAFILSLRGESSTALELSEASARQAELDDYPGVFTICTNQAAAISAKQGDYRRALRHNRANLANNIAAADSVNAPINMYNISYNHRLLGELDSCVVYQNRAIRWVEAASFRRNKAMLPLKLAEFHFLQGNYATVDSLLQVAATRLAHAGSVNDEAELLKNMIRQGLESAQPQLAYRALARLEALRGALYETAADYSLLADIEVETADFLARQGEYLLALEALERGRQTVTTRSATYDEWVLEDGSFKLALATGDLATARQAASRCLDIAENRADQELLAASRYLLGRLSLETDDFTTARELFQDPDSAATYGGCFRTRLLSLIYLGVAYSREGQHDKAAAEFGRAAALFSRQPPRDLAARLQIEAGRSAAASGEVRLAEASLRQALELLQLPGDGADQEIMEALEAFDSTAFREATEALLDLYHDNPDLLSGSNREARMLLLAEACRWHSSALPPSTILTDQTL